MTDLRHDEDWWQSLSAYADDECDLAERKLVAAHLRDCERCRIWLEQVKADRQAFTEALDSSARGVDLSQRIMEEVQQMPKPETPQNGVPGAVAAEPTGGGTAVFRITLVEALVIVVIGAIMLAILFPTFARSREKARQTSCLSNIKQVALGALQFAADHDGKLPDAHRWQEQIMPYVKNEQIFICPGDDARRSSTGVYAMNPRFSGANINDYDNKAELIILYDADEAGRPDPRHNGGLNCAFMDGHAKWMKGIPDDISMTTGIAPPTDNYGLTDKLKLAYTASAEVWVKSVHQAILVAEKTVRDRGGFPLLSSLQAVNEPYSAELICRVPTAEVANTINALGTLGWVARREIRGEDLTRKYLDKTREVATQAARQERLEKVVDKATVATDRTTSKHHVVELEQNLAGSEAAEDAAHSELYEVADRTTLATITATLTQRDREETPISPLAATWRNALGALAGTGIALTRLAIWLLMFAWLWAPLAWLAFRFRRPGRQPAS